MKKRVLSGIRSTGQLHLGNYFGALRNFVKLQDEAECFFFIADYHSLTTHPDPTILHGNVRNILSEYLAAGIDPEKATIYIQSDVPQVVELSLLLGMHAYVGELERTASFKDKVRKNPNNVNIGLLNYPVLMASDILLHRADFVPVGKEGTYNVVLSSDDGEFGGFSRVDTSAQYETTTTPAGWVGFKCYLPNRTAIVLKKK